MKARQSQRRSRALPGAAAAPLFYWLLLVSGLAVVTVQRGDALDKVLPLWVGGVVGTAFGHVLAQRRLRLWLVVFLVVNAMWCGALVSAPFWLSLKPIVNTWEAIELSALSFAPAAICAYLALAERAGLASFWFPAVLWMLAVLERDGASGLGSAPGWLLLAGLGALLVGFLYARETRRVALWQSYGTSFTAPAVGQAVLRQAPLRSAARAGWMAAVGAATVALTAWIAPHLWQRDKVESRRESLAASAPAGTRETGEAASCCPEGQVVEVERSRVREYFPVLHAQDETASKPVPGYCIPCTAGVPLAAGTAGTYGGGTTAGTGPGAAEPTYPGYGTTAPAAAGAPRSHAPAPSTAAPIVVPMAPSVAPPVPVASTKAPAGAKDPRAQAEAPKPQRPVAAAGPRAPAGSPTVVVPVAVAASAYEVDPLRWLLTLAVAGLAVRVVLRPLRRLLTLRHLRHPFWAETVDQRVSNLWELALVGLRDVGWRPGPGEQPQELARRVGLPGLATCATVLERVRHGVRVDAEDLEAMTSAAEAVYTAARLQAGRAARAAAWLRWPLA